MIEVTQLRAGTVFEDLGVPWVVLRYEHVKMGRGSATIRVKIKNLKTGTTVEKSFTNGARVADVILEKKQAQFLFRQGTTLTFMDPTSYEQLEIDESLVGEAAKFLKEGTGVDISFYGEEALAVVLPLKMKFKVTETEPGFKGNSVTNLYKDCVIETGAHVKIPLFINEGEEIIVNTETGDYVERVK